MGALVCLRPVILAAKRIHYCRRGIVNPGAALQRAPKRKTGTPERARLNLMSCGQKSQMLTSVAAMAAAATAW